MKAKLSVLSKNEIYQIHNATMDILENVGVKIFDDEALEILHDAGADVNFTNKLCKIPEYLVRETIKDVPKNFYLYGRIDKYKLEIGNGKTYFSMQGTGLYIFDVDRGIYRESTLNDLEKFYRVGDALNNIHHVAVVVKPKDVPDQISHLYELFLAFKNTIKTVDGNTYTKVTALDTIRLASIVAGSVEELIKKPMLLGFHNPVSPLQHSKELIEGLIIYAKYNQPVIVASDAQAGATAPITISGLLVQQNAEVLSGIVITQLVNPGAPVLYGTASAPLDMKTGNIAFGAVETALINVATTQLAQYYGIPSRGTGGVTDSKIPDMQAGFEKAITLFMSSLAGTNFIYDAAGGLESTLTVCLEQIVIDDELCGMVNRAINGIEVNEETLGLDVIKNVGPGQHYLSQKHTLKHLISEIYMPTIIDRTRRQETENQLRNILDLAHEKVEKILKDHHPEPLDKNVENELKLVIEKIKKERLKNKKLV